MKKAMNKVETKLVVQTGSELAGLPLRRFGADDDLAMLEGDDVSRPGFAQEAPVNFRDPLVRDQDHVHLGESREQTGSSCRRIQAEAQSSLCEFAKRRQLHA